MIDRLIARAEQRSAMMVDAMLDAIDERLIALFGASTVKRGDAEVRVRARDIERRRLRDTEARFFLETLR